MDAVAGDDTPELLFFDTFSHEINEEINLDLVQFPRPVYVTEIRIIPLGARVEADFPGGVRLGATNPSKFSIDFFVNDLSKPGASTFEILGSFEYNQNDCIQLECRPTEIGGRSIPTDGLVLRGWYTTITLAVYGTQTKNITEQIASPPASAVVAPAAEASCSQTPLEDEVKKEWPIETAVAPVPALEASYGRSGSSGDLYQGQYYENQEYQPDNYPSAVDPTVAEKADAPKDPRTFTDEIKRDDGDSHNSRRLKTSHDYGHGRSYDRARESHEFEEGRKRPKSPPSDSSRRPRSPDRRISESPNYSDEDMSSGKGQPIRVIDHGSAVSEERAKVQQRRTQSPSSTTGTPLESPAAIEEDIGSSGEQFEPILSDDEIGDDDSDSQFDMDFECEEYADEFTKSFNPFTVELTAYTPRISKQLTKEFDAISWIIDKFLSRFSAGLSWKSFSEMSYDCKENWVYSTEKIIQYFSLSYQWERSIVVPYIKTLLEDEKKAESIVEWIIVGLSYEAATSQQTYKVRHLKAGIRLIEYLGCFDDIVIMLIKKRKVDVFESLFSLLKQDFMALSLQLLILRAISSLLDTKLGVEYFLGEVDNSTNRYCELLKLMEENPKICVKFALKALVKKINLYESLTLIRDTTSKWFAETGGKILEEDASLLSSCLGEVVNGYTWDEKSYAQPRGLYPIVKKIEHVQDPIVRRGTLHGFHSYFRIHSFLESLVLLVTNSHAISVDLMAKALKMIVALVRNLSGLNYLTDMITTTNLLQRCLLHGGAASEDAYPNPGREIKAHKIAMEIIYKVQAKYYLDAISCVKDDEDEVVEHLFALHALTVTPGRCFVVTFLTMENNINIIIALINAQKNYYAEHPESGKCKSPVLNYAVDILDCVIRNSSNVAYLGEAGQSIVNVVKSHEIFESSVSAMLQEMAIYMKPLEISTIFSYNDVQSLCDVIKRSFDFFTTFPGDLITVLRIARFLAIPDAHGEEIEKWNESEDDNLELRFKFFVMQFYSADGLSLLTSILEKMVNFYQQPSVHVATLASNQGVLTIQILLPCLQVLRRILTCVILARNTYFRDTTAIELLLQVYNLVHCVPKTGAAYADAQMAQEEIIKTLLVYTQPTPEEGVDTESVRKSLWTHLIGDLIKFTLKGPSTFIPGLLVFSELLPLPLPVPTKDVLSESEAAKIVTERQLWSAHLHSQSSNLVELIQSLCTSSYPQLILLLSRVCLQLADLAPNMSLMVSKTIVNLLLADPLTNGVATSHQSRLINFFASLVSHPSVKVSVLSILPGKLMDFLVSILSTENISAAHIQAQENVYEALQALLDSEITMIAPKNAKSRELALACAFPSKELLLPIVNCVLDNFTMDSMPCPLTSLRTMLLMSEHDVMINLLYIEFVKRKTSVAGILKKLVANFTENVDQNRGVIETLIDFLRTLFIIEDVDDSENQLIPPRTLILSGNQLASMINWTSEANDKDKTDAEEEVHALVVLQKFLNQEEICEKHQLEGMLENIRQIVEFIDKERDLSATDPVLEVNIDAALPQAEGIVTQYASRIIFDVSEGVGERLTVNYWLNSPVCSKDIVEEMEQIPCDLADMVRVCLPPETNIVADCKRLLHLVVSPQTTRERPIAAPCFRTRRVEVEPSTGRPEKKIFVTPMRGRGFPRTPQARGDLFRSRPPNTSRPPSLHVDDFLALETCGAQPTGPTGYNKISRDMISIRGSRVGRGRGGFASDRGRASLGANGSGGSVYRASNSPTTWTNPHLTQHMMVDSGQTQSGGHFRSGDGTSGSGIVYGGDYRESQSHFGGAATRARMTRGFARSSARNFTR
ncbi:protein virilizer [Phlebotomus argentipes]|uniref:protein virilizer n=1 Tax=Phlebotomus argentipes TaxID=94469 RepID=UPI0028930C65|nr:protein virilizer [Phlebotomus argentipes]